MMVAYEELSKSKICNVNFGIAKSTESYMHFVEFVELNGEGGVVS